jgi:hypothetical protein
MFDEKARIGAELPGKDKKRLRFVAAHPSRKNKGAARVGHPSIMRVGPKDKARKNKESQA